MSLSSLSSNNHRLRGPFLDSLKFFHFRPGCFCLEKFKKALFNRSHRHLMLLFDPLQHRVGPLPVSGKRFLNLHVRRQSISFLIVPAEILGGIADRLFTVGQLKGPDFSVVVGLAARRLPHKTGYGFLPQANGIQNPGRISVLADNHIQPAFPVETAFFQRIDKLVEDC